MQMLELQIFVGIVVILGAVFVALLCDFLKGNNEQLRERNIELVSRQDEREKLGIFQNPMEWMRTLISGLRQPPMAESLAGNGAAAAHHREAEAFTALRKNGPDAEPASVEGDTGPPLRRRMYDEMKARSQQQAPTWASKEELEQLAERAARIRARHEAHKTQEDKLKEDTATRLTEEVSRHQTHLVPEPPAELEAPEPPAAESPKVMPIKAPERTPDRVISLPAALENADPEPVLVFEMPAAAPAAPKEPLVFAPPKPAPSLWHEDAEDDDMPPPVILAPSTESARVIATATSPALPALALHAEAPPTLEPPGDAAADIARLQVLPVDEEDLEPPSEIPEPPRLDPVFEPEPARPEPQPQPEIEPQPAAPARLYAPPVPAPPAASISTSPAAAAVAVALAPVPEVEPAQEYLEVPAGLHDGVVLQSLIELGLSFNGVAVAIGINDYPSLKEKLAANSGADSLSALNRMVQSMLRPQDFACQFTEDEYILLYPGESGSSAQRRLFQVSEKLWDFQLRSLGHLSVMFSWGGLEVQNERLQEAVASARERMYQTRRNRKPGAGEGSGSRKRVANG